MVQGSRKLVAVLFTDVKSFSSSMQADEEQTLRLLLEVHHPLLQEEIEGHAGKVVQTTAWMV